MQSCNFKLRFSNPIYKVWDNNGTTLCIYSCTIICQPWNASLGHFKVTGVAKCHPSDSPDPVLGKHIAESRAKAKAYKKAYKYALERFLPSEDHAKRLLEFSQRNKFLMKEELKHIEDLVK